jgi:hypothetical protein
MSNPTVISHILPLPGTPGTPYFRGAGCTNFLIYYEDMCEDYNVTEREQVRRLPRYCAEHISISIKGFKAYEESDWKGLKKAMLKQFREADPQQQMYTRAFLESLVSASRTPAEVPQYSTQFLSVSKRLLDQGKIGKLDQSSLYVQGLPERVRRELFYRSNLDFDDDERPIDLLIFIEQAERIVSSEQKF